MEKSFFKIINKYIYLSPLTILILYPITNLMFNVGNQIYIISVMSLRLRNEVWKTKIPLLTLVYLILKMQCFK